MAPIADRDPLVRDDPSALSPPQAALRFGLELAALTGWGIAGARLVDGRAGWPAAVGLPLVAATAWGVFRVPGDASANGGAPVPVSGRVRLVLEAVVLLGSAVAVAATGRPVAGSALGLGTAAHYATTRCRVRWLLVH